MRKNSNAIARIVIWSIVAFVLIGVLVFFIGFSSSSRLLSFLPVSFGESYGDQSSFSIGSAELEATDIHNIELIGVSGSVRLYPYDGDTIVIREDSNLSSDDQLRYLVQGDKLIIQFRKSGRFFNWGTKSLNKDLELMLPNDLAAQLQLVDIESVSASVAVEQISAERCWVEQISGETQVTDVNLDLLDIEAVSGDIFV